jgi:prefoldin subunit 5
MAISPEQLWAHFDALQSKQAALEARVDHLCNTMNEFVSQAREQLEAMSTAHAPKESNING